MNDSDGLLVDGDKVGERRLGKLLEVDGQFYQIEVARDVAFVKLQRAENVVLGQVRVPEGISEFLAFGRNGYFLRKPAKGEFTLPVGQYRIQSWKMARKDARGGAWELSAYNFNNSARFTVVDDKPVSLEVGEPMRAALDIQKLAVPRGSKGPTNQYVFNLRFEGRYGESLQIMNGDQRPPGPRLTLTSLDGSYRYTNTFEFG